MISSLQILNFQSHKKTHIEFSPGINAIIGASDHGKSAILRALLWVVYNRPMGDGYVSSWAKDKKGKLLKETSVVVQKGEKSLARIRTKDFNGYVSGEDRFEALRSEVPAVVKSFFNLTGVNIQRQHDPAFLLSSGGIEVAKFFNEIIKLDQIDKTLSIAENKRREGMRELRQHEVVRDNLIKQLEQFDWIETAEIALNKAEVYKTKLDDKIQQRTELERLRITHTQARSVIIKNRWVDEATILLKQVDEIKKSKDLAQRLHQILQSLSERHHFATQLVSGFDKWTGSAQKKLDEVGLLKTQNIKLTQNLQDLKGTLQTYQKATNIVATSTNIEHAGNDLEKAQVLQNKINKLRAKHSSVSISLNTWNHTSEIVKNLNQDIEMIRAELPKVCPLCKQKLPV